MNSIDNPTIDEPAINDPGIDDPAIDERYDFARTIVLEAGALALAYFNDLASLKVQSKGVQDVVSEADINTENLIRAGVKLHFRQDEFLGEESSASFQHQPGKGTWIVDPIDGTQPFISGIRSWCISIAYVEAGGIRLGVIHDPTGNELFAARQGRGASMNGREIRASAASSLQDGLVSVGYSNRVQPEATLGPLTRLMKAKGMYHRSGSGALSLAYVGAGRLIGYFEPHMNSWDFAAGAIIVREAGGRTNDCLPSAQAMLKGGVMLAAAPGVYDELSVVAGSPD